MFKKMTCLALSSFCFISINAFSMTCPSVQDIHRNQLQGFKLYDAEDNQPLSHQRIAAFKKEIHTFSMAQLQSANRQGVMQCFYRDKEGSDLDAYLSKTNLTLGQNKKYWYPVTGYMQCAANETNCAFQQKPVMVERLAKN